jgi:hypothetical protein
VKFKQCLLVSQNTPSLSFRFDIENDLSIERTLTISSKWNEAGFAVAQAAAEEPIELSLTGKIGYLVAGDTLLNNLNEGLDRVQNRLSIVQAAPLGGLIGSQVKTVQKAVTQAQTVVKAADNFLTKINNEINGNKRLEDIYGTLKSMYSKKELLKIETPLETIENVLITRVSPSYEENTDQSISISISLKEIRFVKLKTANLNKALFAQNMCRADIGLSGSVDSGQAAVAPKKSKNTSAYDAGGLRKL